MSKDAPANDGYWSANLRLVGILLAIWAVSSFGLGILFRPFLKGIEVGGTDLGFWFAQQGSIYIFVALIFIYAFLMNRLDRRYGVSDDDR